MVSIFIGYAYDECGKLAHYIAYRNPARRPVLIALTDQVYLRQTAVRFEQVSPSGKPGTAVRTACGGVTISTRSVVMVPETGVYSDIDVEEETAVAKVLNIRILIIHESNMCLM